MTMPDLPARCCATCRHAYRAMNDLLCRRYPPTPLYGSTVARFPVMDDGECCGEWAGMEAAPAPDADTGTDTGGAAFLRTRLLLAEVLYGKVIGPTRVAELSTPERVADAVRERLRHLTAVLGVP